MSIIVGYLFQIYPDWYRIWLNHNHNNLPTWKNWNVRPFGDYSPNPMHDSSDFTERREITKIRPYIYI